MPSVFRSLATAVGIALAVQVSTIGLAPNLPRDVCRPPVEQTREFTFPAAELVRLQSLDGSVAVRTHSETGVTVSATVSAFPDTTQAKMVAEGYARDLPAITHDNGVLTIITEPESRPDAMDLRVDYILSVPEGTDLQLEVGEGNVIIGQGCGAVTVEGNNSDIEIVGPRGAVHASSTNGRIRVYAAESNTVLRTVNGSLFAEVQGGQLEAYTTVGSIEARLLGAALQRCDLTTKNGDIRLALPDGVSAAVHAQAARGRVESAFIAPTAMGSPQRRREYRGELGGGQAPVLLTAQNGDIQILRSSPPL